MSIPCVVVIDENVLVRLIQCNDGDHAEKIFIHELNKIWKKRDWPKSQADALEDGEIHWEDGAAYISWTEEARTSFPGTQVVTAEPQEEVYCIDCIFIKPCVTPCPGEPNCLCTWGNKTTKPTLSFVTKQKIDVMHRVCADVNYNGHCPTFAKNHGEKPILSSVSD